MLVQSGKKMRNWTTTDGDMSNKYFWGLLETACVVGQFTPLSTSEMLHSTSFFGSHFSTMGFKFLSHGHPYNFGWFGGTWYFHDLGNPKTDISEKKKKLFQPSRPMFFDRCLAPPASSVSSGITWQNRLQAMLPRWFRDVSWDSPSNNGDLMGFNSNSDNNSDNK